MIKPKFKCGDRVLIKKNVVGVVLWANKDSANNTIYRVIVDSDDIITRMLDGIPNQTGQIAVLKGDISRLLQSAGKLAVYYADEDNLSSFNYKIDS
jgi:hypothetical protein